MRLLKADTAGAKLVISHYIRALTTGDMRSVRLLGRVLLILELEGGLDNKRAQQICSNNSKKNTLDCAEA